MDTSEMTYEQAEIYGEMWWSYPQGCTCGADADHENVIHPHSNCPYA